MISEIFQIKFNFLKLIAEFTAILNCYDTFLSNYLFKFILNHSVKKKKKISSIYIDRILTLLQVVKLEFKYILLRVAFPALVAVIIQCSYCGKKNGLKNENILILELLMIII